MKSEDEIEKQLRKDFLPEIWPRYSELIAKRDDHRLSVDEHQELITISDQLELAQADRLDLIAELATRRNMPMEALMLDLGIRPRKL